MRSFVFSLLVAAPLALALPAGPAQQQVHARDDPDCALEIGTVDVAGFKRSSGVAANAEQARHEKARRATEVVGRGSGVRVKRKVVRKRNCVAVALVADTDVSTASTSVESDPASSSSSTSSPTSTSASSTVTIVPTSTSTLVGAATIATSVASYTSSALDAASTAAAASGLSGTLGELFPMSTKNSWTTCTESSSAMSFSAALLPLTAGNLPSSSTAPDGSLGLIANYPANTFSYSSTTGHGFSFYTEGQHNGVSVEGASEVLFSYSAFFPAGFDFVKGGKMPGLYGGTSVAQAKSCSGGRQDNRDECFSARLMWRTNGMGEFYNYYPTSVQQGNGYCQTAPYSICDTVYGDSIGRGAFSWSTGKWTTVAQRVKLNTLGQADGEQQLWVDGVAVLHLTGLEIVVKSSKIYGIMAQTFFGGSDSSWDTPRNQSVWFKDWSLAVIS